MGPKLIINADDLAIHPNINKGITEAFQHGILTSTTLLLTTPFLDDAIEQTILKTQIPTGLHLSLTLGSARSVRRQGSFLQSSKGELFLSAAGLIRALTFSKRAHELLIEIEEELVAQLEFAKTLGLEFTHLDSHQHLHMHPKIFPIFTKLAKEYGFTKIRFVREHVMGVFQYSEWLTLLSRQNYLKLWLLNYFSSKVQNNLTSTDNFFGIMASGMLTQFTLQNFILSMRKGRSYEIGVHPGYRVPFGGHYPQAGFNKFLNSQLRETELFTLLSQATKETLRKCGVQLISYRDL